MSFEEDLQKLRVQVSTVRNPMNDAQTRQHNKHFTLDKPGYCNVLIIAVNKDGLPHVEALNKIGAEGVKFLIGKIYLDLLENH